MQRIEDEREMEPAPVRQGTGDRTAEREAEREADLDAGMEASPTGLEIDPEDLQPRAWKAPEPRRVAQVVGVLLVLVALAVVPPLISANRFRKRIAQSVSESLGRPVHMDSVTLNLLPMPGFTLENFVVTEDPAFGSEPVIEARTVRVTLRVWSLWRRRVEFSRISLDDPSVNLVHRADGRWNIESILLQAAKMEAAPTAQAGAGPAPRFPYIEATGARINVKMGLEKLPLALTEADLALWLPEPSQWRLRLEGHPTRTDTAPTDTGTVRIQGTLGKAATVEDVPVDVAAEWRDAPLGGVSWVLLARDAGFRGALTLRTSVRGTVRRNTVESHLAVHDLRRSDFVPAHTLDIDLSCTGQTLGMFHQVRDLHCGWPSGAADDGTTPGVTLAAQVPNVTSPGAGSAEVSLHDAPASAVLDALRVASTRVSPNLNASGTVSGRLVCCLAGQSMPAGRLTVAAARLSLGDGKPFVSSEVAAELEDGALTMRPVAIDLGAGTPAQLDGRVDGNGYTLHLGGAVVRTRLLELAKALPQFGDGLAAALPESAPGASASSAPEQPLRVDLNSSRSWSGAQTWTPVTTAPARVKPRRWRVR